MFEAIGVGLGVFILMSVAAGLGKAKRALRDEAEPETSRTFDNDGMNVLGIIFAVIGGIYFLMLLAD